MADTSRKRSRKSKLVPRDCVADEDDLELQIPAQKICKSGKQSTKRQVTKKVIVQLEPTISKTEEACNTSVLKKINASSSSKQDNEPQNIGDNPSISPRKFEIDIEVESCDDEQFAGFGDDDKLQTTPIQLSLETILNAADNIVQNSTDVADQILNVYVRNTIGYEDVNKQNQLVEQQEKLIQQSIDEWRTWQFRSFHRENPLFYKCYICLKSWWHLTEFRNHMSSEHSDDSLVIIALERYELHEANVVAFHERMLLDIYTEGPCYRCGKDYAAHTLDYRFQKKFYKNEGCTKQFLSCKGLRDHCFSCPVCEEQDKTIKCDVCKSRFEKKEELNDHLVLSHLVRSDIPIMTKYKKCKICAERYTCDFLHKCRQKGALSECPHCLRSFSNVVSLQMHLEQSDEPYKCEVCRIVMTYSCKKYEHMLTHTDKYLIVRKCVACEGLKVFLNDEDAVGHWLLKHEWETKCPTFFPKMIVPSSCLYNSLAKSESIEEESVLEEKESVPDGQESIPDEEESIPNEEESIPDEEESIPNEEESIPEEEESIKIEEESIPDEKESIKIEVESALNEEEFLPEEELISKSRRKSAFMCERKLLEAKLESATEFLFGTVAVKEEPVDSEDNPQIIIKEEPLEEFAMHVEENLTENFEHEVCIKEECVVEEYEDYEGDIIKLNFNIEDILSKEKCIEDDDNCSLEQTEENREVSQSEENREASQSEDDADYTEESQQSQESLQEPEVAIKRGDKRNKKLYKCTKCGFTAKHRQYRNHIEYDCGSNLVKHKTYICTKCDNKYVSMKKYLTHFKEHGYKHLSCPDCLKDFDTFTNLGQHFTRHIKHSFIRVKMITHDGTAMAKPDYQCKKCGKIIAFHNFFEHYELHINAQPTHPIKVTSRPRHRHGELHETIIKECIARLNKQPKECNHCHRWFKRVNECKRHIIEHLLTDAYNQKHIYNELKCQVCEQGFGVPEKYKQHMRDHASLPVYKCELCDRTFSDSSNFTKHKKVHNLTVIICDLCGKKFQSKLSLQKHIEKHQSTDPITCKICDKVFYFDTSYRRHVRYFHDKTVIGFRCVICSERFDTLKLKWDHMWEAHKERKQKADCPICHASFRKYSDVRLHARLNHLTEVSVLNVKKNARNPNLDIDKYLSDPATVKVGMMETLVIYDSD